MIFYFPSDDADDLDGSPWWAGRGDFGQPRLGGAPRSDEELSDVSSGRVDGSGVKKRPTQFTEYSITSSVVPRSEGTAATDTGWSCYYINIIHIAVNFGVIVSYSLSCGPANV